LGLRRAQKQERSRGEYSEDLHDLYSLPSIYRVIKPVRLRWTGNVAYIEKRRREYGVLLEKPERKRPFGRSKLRWKDNIKTGLQLVGWGSIDWIDLSLVRNKWRSLVNVTTNLQVP